MTRTPIQLPQQRQFGETSRLGAWWLQPLLVFLGLGAFIVYSTWAAFQGAYYASGPYLSPMYSPLIWEGAGQATSGHNWLGHWPDWLPAAVVGLPITPAFLILWAPGGFRFTCYYYRGAYYKAFWADPISCAVGEPRKSYWGERKFPLILQNIHRYFFYVAALFIVILTYDALVAMWFPPEGMTYAQAHEAHALEFGFGIGTLVLIVNPVLLGLYTFGCHSFRHIIGGHKDCVTKAPAGKKAYECVSCLNKRHMLYAWMSLFWVGFTDFYVRMCAMGYWTDLRIF
ncbi:succinate dehydrogenase [Planctomycetales bacterium ZRK34]|nr:succinate dehydrogenase [Planctomycetales bacterium ZRK34]